MQRDPWLRCAIAVVLQGAAAHAQDRSGDAGYRRPAPRDPASTLVREAVPTPPAEYRLAHPELVVAPRLGPPRLGPGALAGGAVAALGLAAVLRGTGGPTPARSPSRRPPAETDPGAEVRRVTVVLDAAGGEALVASLAGLAGVVDLGVPSGRHGYAVALRDALAQAHALFRYAAFQSFFVDRARVSETFGWLADRARGAVEVAPTRDGAGDGVAVTLLVAVRGASPPLPATMRLASLLAVLDALVPARPEQLIGVEMVLSSSCADGRAVPVATLRAAHPELLPLAADAAAPTRVCPSCLAVVSAGPRCVACGAG